MAHTTFCAIDFETANPTRGSICAMGVVRFDTTGKIIDGDTSLIRPPAGLDTFAPINMRIHKISARKVIGAPEWQQMLPRLVAFVGDDLLVAHNAAFERSAITAASLAVHLDDPQLPIACTVKMSQVLLPQLANHKLPTVAAHLGVPVLDHHSALDDAAMCGLIAVELLKHARPGTTMAQLAAACRALGTGQRMLV